MRLWLGSTDKQNLWSYYLTTAVLVESAKIQIVASTSSLFFHKQTLRGWALVPSVIPMVGDHSRDSHNVTHNAGWASCPPGLSFPMEEAKAQGIPLLWCPADIGKGNAVNV